MSIPVILCGVLFLLVVFLVIKIWLIKKDMNEICKQIKEHFSDDTNTLLSLSSRDRSLRNLVIELNKALHLLREQRQQYLSGNRELKEEITNISHDLRTPLTAISGYLDLLEKEDKTVTVERYISIINNRVDLLKQLTEELFCYATVVTYKGNFEIKRVAINEVLENSIAEFYGALMDASIIPNIKMTKRKVYRNLNPSALSRVFSNLLSNVIKYGSNDLDIMLSEKGEITFINTALDLNEVEVAKLFQRFYTVQSAKNSTGLGLAIARNLVEQMNGTITAEYNNSRFKIQIIIPDNQNSQYT